MPILTHEHFDISHDREAIFLVYQRVGGSFEYNIRDQFGLLIHSSVLPDRNGDCEVALREVWANSFISKDHIYAYYGILGIFGPLEQHVHEDVLSEV